MLEYDWKKRAFIGQILQNPWLVSESTRSCGYALRSQTPLNATKIASPNPASTPKNLKRKLTVQQTPVKLLEAPPVKEASTTHLDKNKEHHRSVIYNLRSRCVKLLRPSAK